MKKLIMLVLVSFFCQCAPAFSFDSDPTEPSSGDGLELTIRVSRKAYLAGEPIPLEYTLRNVSQQQLMFYLRDRRALLYNSIDLISIADSQKRPLKKVILFEQPDCYLRDDFVILGPQDEWSENVDLMDLYHPIRYPGEYEISATYANNLDYYNCQDTPVGIKQIGDTHIDTWRGKIASNSIIIEIKEAEKEFLVPEGKVVLGMDIEEVKKMLRIGNYTQISRGIPEGTEEVELSGYYSALDGNITTLKRRLYDFKGGAQGEDFGIFFRNGRVLTWERY
ncbi:MAG: hypothetical protein PHG40_02050 [Candidatus Omnitrophica bacterium]|nr:hypothetical protein [Candidatus Omnitrophota bacterium]